MTVVNPSQSNAGDTIEAADINNPINQLAAVINGAIDATNIAANGVTVTQLADSAVTPAKVLAGTGSSWAYSSWTPTWTNLSIGNGTLSYSKYIQTGKTIHFRLKLVIGSTTSITGQVAFSLPATANADAADEELLISNAKYSDTGVASYPGYAMFASTTTAKLVAWNAAGTYAAEAQVTSTAPFTFGNLDVIRVAGSYEAA